MSLLVPQDLVTVQVPPDEALASALDFIVPVNVEDGDLVFVCIGTANTSNATVTAPAGWTEIGPITVSGTTELAFVFYRYVTAAEAGSSWTFSMATAGSWVTQSFVVRSDVDQYIAVIDVEASAAGAYSPSVTASAHDLGIAIQFSENATQVVPIVNANPPPEAIDYDALYQACGFVTSSPNSVGIGVATYPDLAAGTFGTIQWATLSGVIHTGAATILLTEVRAPSAQGPNLVAGALNDVTTGAPYGSLFATAADNGAAAQDVTFPSAGTGNWAVGAGCLIGRQTPGPAPRPGGLAATGFLQLASTSSADMWAYVPMGPAAAAETYSVAALLNPTTGGVVKVGIEFLDGGGSPIGSWVDGAPLTAPAGKYAVAVATAVAPGGTASYRMRVYLAAPSGAGVLLDAAWPIGVRAALGFPMLLRNNDAGLQPDALWMMDELPGVLGQPVTTVHDWTANGHDLTSSGAPAWGSQGVIANDPSRTSMGGGPGLSDVTSTYTPAVGGWTGVELEATFAVPSGCKQGLVDIPSTADIGFDALGSGKVVFNVYDSGGTLHTIFTDARLDDGAPHHVVGQVGVLGMILYVDGVAQSTTHVTVNTWQAPTDHVSLGYNPYSGLTWQVGRLGPCAIWPDQESSASILERATAFAATTGALNAFAGGGNAAAQAQEYEYSADQLNWAPVRNGVAVVPTAQGDGSYFDTLNDYEVVPLTPTYYRVRSVGRDAATGLALFGDWSATQVVSTASTGTAWYLLDPLDPTTAVGLDLAQDYNRKIHEVGGTFYPFGRSTAIKSTDGMKGRWDGDWTFHPASVAARNKLLALLESTDTLLIQSPLGEQGYVMHDPGTDSQEKLNLATVLQHPWFDVSTSFLTAPRP